MSKYILLAMCALASAAGSTCRILSLSGGGSYGAFEAGVISKLIDDGKGGWDYISGVSAGSLNAFYLSGIPPNKEKEVSPTFEKLWESIKDSDVYSLSFFTNGQSLFDTTPLRKTMEEKFAGITPVRPVQIQLPL